MRVLFLTEHDPLDMTYGGGQRTHFIWCALKQKYPCLETVIPVPMVSKEMFDADNSIRRICFEKRYSIRWFLVRVWLRIFKHIRWPGLISNKRLNEFYPEGFDFIVVRYTGLAALHAAWNIAPMILDVDDVPTQSFETNWNGRKGFWFKLCLNTMKAWEKFVFRKAKLLWIANPENKNIMSRDLSVFTLPNIPRADHPIYSDYISPEKYVFYLGCLAGQVRDIGIDYVLNHYWTEIHRRFPDLKFKIAGPYLSQEFKEKWSNVPNVEVLGFVEDIENLYKNARAMFAPISAGAGTAIKVLECLSYGRVCVGTPFAWRGCEFASSAKLVFENCEELLDAFEIIMNDDGLMVRQNDGVRVVSAYRSFDYFSKCLSNSMGQLNTIGTRSSDVKD